MNRTPKIIAASLALLLTATLTACDKSTLGAFEVKIPGKHATASPTTTPEDVPPPTAQETPLTGDDAIPPTTEDAPPPTSSQPRFPDLVSAAKTALPTLPTVKERPKAGGYDRSCKPGAGCVFGPSWSDDQNAPMGHNGCDTRNDVLGLELTDVTYKGRSKCVVTSGNYIEPYFGTPDHFVKGDSQVKRAEIDHVLPLALAWDLGMDQRPMEQRMELANDTEYNLVVTTREVNALGRDVNKDKVYDASLGEFPGKSDKTAAEWLPWVPHAGPACDYSARYVLTAQRYGLPILEADKVAITAAFARCS